MVLNTHRTPALTIINITHPLNIEVLINQHFGQKTPFFLFGKSMLS